MVLDSTSLAGAAFREQDWNGSVYWTDDTLGCFCLSAYRTYFVFATRSLDISLSRSDLNVLQDEPEVLLDCGRVIVRRQKSQHRSRITQGIRYDRHANSVLYPYTLCS